jgi:hypothetical protein
VVRHDAVGEEPNAREPLAGQDQNLDERLVVPVGLEQPAAAVAAVQGVVDESTWGDTRRARHRRRIAETASTGQIGLRPRFCRPTLLPEFDLCRFGPGARDIATTTWHRMTAADWQAMGVEEPAVPRLVTLARPLQP